jgi:hypothetical protein
MTNQPAIIPTRPLGQWPAGARLLNIGCSSTKYTRVLIGGVVVAATRYYPDTIGPREHGAITERDPPQRRPSPHP